MGHLVHHFSIADVKTVTCDRCGIVRLGPVFNAPQLGFSQEFRTTAAQVPIHRQKSWQWQKMQETVPWTGDIGSLLTCRNYIFINLSYISYSHMAFS